MAALEEITWFKTTFADAIIPRLRGTPISFDLVCAIAFQESGELWSRTRRTLPLDEVLRLAVGDTLDTPNRSAFPKDKAHLLSVERGDEMFALAHRLLGEMAEATGIDAYRHVAAKPHKFVHGYGLFQYDLQFFKDDPGFFLEEQWKDLDVIIAKMLGELMRGVRSLGYDGKTSLTDKESCFVAIVYNAGFRNFRKERGLEQGHFDGVHYYGENIDSYLKIAHAIPTPAVSAPLVPERVETDDVLPAVAEIALREYDKYHGTDEGTQPLRGRIADYYEAGGGSRTLDPTRNENAWSAAFVSFCMKQAGVTSAQFRFNLSHSVFINAAIANALSGSGVFRGHRVTQYTPRPGDLIHHNRNGGTLSYDFARDHTGYPSHSCIVVGFEEVDGIRHAVTIGGNEHMPGGGGTVGRKRFALDANGFLDQSRISAKLICVVENLTDVGSARTPASLGRYEVNVRTNLMLRGGSDPSFPIIKKLKDGVRLTVLELVDAPTGRWASVDLEGDGRKDGFVFASFLVPASR